jgi:hypothetical protein
MTVFAIMAPMHVNVSSLRNFPQSFWFSQFFKHFFTKFGFYDNIFLPMDNKDRNG